MLPHLHKTEFDHGICATVHQLRDAPLPPDVEMRVESIIRHGQDTPLPHEHGEDSGGVFLKWDNVDVYALTDRDYYAVKEALNL